MKFAITSVSLILTILRSSWALFGYYSVDHWFQATYTQKHTPYQTTYEGYYDPSFPMKIGGFIPFSVMEDKRFSDNAFGFPKGARGSALIPTIFYFIHLVHRNAREVPAVMRIPNQHHYVPIYLHWDKLLSKCNDSVVPLCSWHYFVSFADPFMIDLNALHLMNNYMTFTPACNVEEDKQFGCPSDGTVLTDLYNFHVPLTLGNCYPIKSKAHVSLIYIFTVCYHYENHISRSPFLRKICPDPCRRRPCELINFAAGCRPTGIFKDSFVCKCLPRYEWDPVAQRCVLKNFCVNMHTKDSICHETGTDRCEFHEVTGAKCICRREYMGHDCSEKRDPCIDIDNGISGNDACNVAFGNNKCEPINGTTHYICRCGRNYAANPNLPYDNCKKKDSPCARTLCIFGSCRVTDDGNFGACVCDPDYKGPHCDIPRGAWSAWYAWTECAPACSSQPQRRRVRDCIGETDDCIGVIEEVEECASLECPQQGNPEEVESALMFAMVMRTAQIGVVSVLLGLAVLVTLSGLSSRQSVKQAQLAKMEARKRFESRGSLADVELPEETDESTSIATPFGWDWNWEGYK